MTPAYDRELIAEMLDELAEAALNKGGSWFSVREIAEQARLLREADNAEAAKVGTVAASEASPAEQVGEDGLPPLPKPFGKFRWGDGSLDGFTAEQTRAYAIEARRLAASGQGVERWDRKQSFSKWREA